jgi:hypothetical protein
MGELERTKFELSKCKSENAILNIQIQTLKINGELRDITNLELELDMGPESLITSRE